MKLQYDEPLSNFAFNFNLHHYTKGGGAGAGPTAVGAAATTNALLASMALLEAGLMEHEYGHVDSATALLKHAGAAIGCWHEAGPNCGEFSLL